MHRTESTKLINNENIKQSKFLQAPSGGCTTLQVRRFSRDLRQRARRRSPDSLKYRPTICLRYRDSRRLPALRGRGRSGSSLGRGCKNRCFTRWLRTRSRVGRHTCSSASGWNGRVMVIIQFRFGMWELVVTI